MSSLKGKVAVVTGASSGIGLAIARALAGRGCELALASRRAIRKQSFSGMLARSCDVRDPESVESFFKSVRDRLGRVDILVNNAGLSHALRNIEDMPVELFRDVLDTNLLGTFLCTRAALPLMNRGAVIVNNLSICAVQVFAQQSAYCAAKFGALGFTNVLREECRPRGIRVVSLIPGATDTDIWNQFMPEAPRDKMLRPETIADAVVNALFVPESASIDELRITPVAGAL